MSNKQRFTLQMVEASLVHLSDCLVSNLRGRILEEAASYNTGFPQKSAGDPRAARNSLHIINLTPGKISSVTQIVIFLTLEKQIISRMRIEPSKLKGNIINCGCTCSFTPNGKKCFKLSTTRRKYRMKY